MDNGLLEGFRGWLEGRVSGDTAGYYVSVVRRGEWPPSRGKHVRAWRNYAHYLFSIGRIRWEEYQGLLLYLKTSGSQAHRTLEAVSPGLLRVYRARLEAAGLGWLHTLLLGGSRLKHIVLMLEAWAPEEEVVHPTGRLEPRLACHGGWCRYYLGVREGSKRVDYIYYPSMWGGGKPDLSGWEPAYGRLKEALRRLGVEASKYRKFANQRLAELAVELNMPQDSVHLIMSRGLTVTGAHYLNTRDWADRLFQEYLVSLKERFTLL